jgi:RNA polymerase sigma-70 factor (ECF subfamily)
MATVAPNEQVAQTAVADRFTALFRAQYAYVWGTVRRLGVREADAEDVVHDVFMRIYDKLDTFDPTRPEKPWCFVFVYRAACDYRKLSRHRVEVMVEQDAPSSSPSAQEGLERADDMKLVHDALEQIELERRAVLVAYEMDDIPMKAIADAMEIPLFTAYSRLRLAREDFRLAVARLERERGKA